MDNNQTGKSNNKTMILVIILLFALTCIALYLLYGRDEKKEEPIKTQEKQIENSNNPNVYKNDELTIKLEEYNSTTDEDGDVTKYYYLYKDDNKEEVSSKHSDNEDVLIVGNDNSIYLLNTETNKIIASYNSDNKVNAEGHNGWYAIYDGNEKNAETAVQVVNKDTGKSIHLDKGKAKEMIFENNNAYIIFDNKANNYSKFGEILNTISYENLYGGNSATSISYGLYNDIVKKNNIYYLIKIENDEIALKELEQNQMINEDGSTILALKIKDASDDEKNEYILQDEDGNIYVDVIYYEKDDENYIIYSNDKAQCTNSILVDKNTGKVLHEGINLDFVKTDKGYYFTEGDCITDFGEVRIYTPSWEKMGTEFIRIESTDSNGNVFVANDGYIEIKDINNNLIKRSKYYEEIGTGIVVNDILYVVVRTDNKIYMIALDSNLEEISKTEIKASSIDFFEPYLEAQDGKIVIDIETEEGDIYFDYDISSELVEILEDFDLNDLID